MYSPNGKAMKTLEEICLRITDGSHYSPQSTEKGYPMASVKDLTPFGIDLTSCRKISKSDFDELVRQGCRPEENDVLIAKDGNSCLETVCVYQGNENVVLLSSVAILRPDISQIIPRFLSLYLSDVKVKQNMKETLVSGSAIPRVVLKAFRQYRIPVPSIEVQNRIVNVIGSLDDKIELNRRMNETLEQMAIALYKHWFVDFGPFQDREFVDSEAGMIPEGWKAVDFLEFAEILGGGTPKTTISEYWGGSIAWISVKDLKETFVISTEKTITDEGVKNSSAKLIPSLSTVISARGTVGATGITSEDMTINQSCYAIHAISDAPYFTYLTVKQAIDDLKRNSHGSVFSTITRDTLLGQRFSYDSNSVASFEITVAPWFELILSNLLESATLKKTRDYLLPRLLSGEIELKDAERQAEEVLSHGETV